MLIEALDVVKQIIDEQCPNIYWTDRQPSGIYKHSSVSCLVIGREDSAWTQWVITFCDDYYFLCKDTTWINPMSSEGLEVVEKLFGIPVEPIFIHEKDAADKLTKLLRKLNQIIQ